MDIVDLQSKGICWHAGKSYYVAKVDFRRCVERHSINVKPHTVHVRRVRRQAVRTNKDLTDL